MFRAYGTPGVIAAMCAILLMSCAGSPTQQRTGEYVDDAALTAKVKTALIQSDDVDALEVAVDTVKGVVELSGFVGSEAEAIRAEEIAAAVEGVKRVENDIEVRTDE